jgi:ABC-2 type transport system ATP-binding protein
MADAAIEVEKLTKDYPYGFLQLKKKRSLDALTMQVQTGEVFGFLGPNGAGKSTTIKLLMRLIFPTAGTARMLGKPISDIAMHRDIGYLPEQPYFYDYLTATELLDYFARFHDFSANERRERVARTLKKVGLADSARVQLRKFSKGMLQRVGLAQAILHDPELVVLDEPMSGLDPVGRREVRDIILELKKQGKTVLFSTHILSDAEMLCDRVGVIAGPGRKRGRRMERKRNGGAGYAHRRPLPGAGGGERVVPGDREIANGQREDIVRVASKAFAGRIFHASGGGRPEASGNRRGE